MKQPVADTLLTDRCLLPTSHAGPFSTAFMATARPAPASRFRGALLGTACGDALGRPVETRTPAAIQARYGELRDFVPWRGWTGGPTGTFTDDTQLAIWSARAVLEAGDEHPERFSRILAERLGNIRGIGRATRQAVVRLKEGNPWWLSGTPSAGNGVAMRAVSLGLAFADDLETLRRQTARNAVVTHADRLAVASGIVQAYAVARLARTPSGALDPQVFLAELADVLGDLTDAAAVERRPNTGRRPVRLADRILELGDMLDLEPSEAFAHTHNGAFVLESLPAAIWAFLSRPDQPEEAIVVAVNGGYDTDTVAAMAGAMAGAYNGEAALPDRWLDDLEAADQIRHIAEQLHGSEPTDPTEPQAPTGADQSYW